ncbi:MAG: H4MPT-linked C1 transfer pathway protein [Thermoprotei archaeon ex4572_64]|nr:MAG: H4MPT-linked C1 transfer pathway protein [Thermoprotei archaeon ex4572_64]
MSYVLGLDIGGANVKAVIIDSKSNVLFCFRKYFPLWIVGKEALKDILHEIYSHVRSSSYVVSTCMTAELCDVYNVKSEGVIHVAKTVLKVFHDAKDVFFVNTNCSLGSLEDLLREPIKYAATNWAANAWLLKKLCSNGIMIDIGSTSTSIVIVINGKIDIRGYTDPEKLIHGELVYTGILRTNIATLVDKVPFKGYYTRVCAEKFALTGDVHLVLGNIAEQDYTTETANGRGRSLREAYARIARVPCADAELLNEYEIREIARYVQEVQIFKIFEALMQIRSRIASMGVDPDNFKVYTVGLGEFLVKEAARRAGFKEIISIDDALGKKVSNILPAYASALMALEESVV